MRLLLLVLIAALSIYLVTKETFGMSPGTLDQLQSTSTRPMRGPYLLY